MKIFNNSKERIKLAAGYKISREPEAVIILDPQNEADVSEWDTFVIEEVEG